MQLFLISIRLHQSEARTTATVWNWSGKTFFPGAVLAVLYFSFVPYFCACLNFPSPPLSALGSPRMARGHFMLSIIDLQSSAQFTSGSNPVNLNLGFFFLLFKSIFSDNFLFFFFFLAFNHQIVGKNKGYFNSASNNPAMGISVGLTTQRQLPPRCGTISNNKIPEPTYNGVTQNQNLRLFHTDKKKNTKELA